MATGIMNPSAAEQAVHVVSSSVVAKEGSTDPKVVVYETDAA
jgi:hypothetical protein